jgi:hypothetical protein
MFENTTKSTSLNISVKHLLDISKISDYRCLGIVISSHYVL